MGTSGRCLRQVDNKLLNCLCWVHERPWCVLCRLFWPWWGEHIGTSKLSSNMEGMEKDIEHGGNGTHGETSYWVSQSSG